MIDAARRPIGLTMSRRAAAAWAAGVLALVLAAYANHFQNAFHFDDSHSVVDNPFIRDLRNIPRFFTDATTFSILPLNQSYRPVLQTTLAVDYRVAGGYHPRPFHLDSFAWFLLQLVCMAGLFWCVITRAAGEGEARAGAVLATAIYALHPAGAETVNYIIQRGEILSTLGVVAALWMYAASPAARRWRLWILPALFGALAKPPALVLPALMACYVVVVERPVGKARRAAWIEIGVAIAVSAACGWWMASRTPPTYVTGAASPEAYWLSQPFVALRYVLAFFAPVGLSADNDWETVTGAGDPRALAGFAFVAAAIAAAVRAGRSPRSRPIAFGVWWFLLALAPTAVTPLAEVANDHRMFFPFVGLSLAVVWSLMLAANWLPAFAGDPRKGSPLQANRGEAARVEATQVEATPSRVEAARTLVEATPSWGRLTVPVLIAAVLVACAFGVRQRNEVWRSDETLWLDVTRKSPSNARGWMNYGLSRMERGDYATAIQSFERGRELAPNYDLMHVNLGVAYGASGRAADAEASFRRAQALSPGDWRTHLYFARWLSTVARLDEARAEAAVAVSLNPADEASRTLASRLGSGGPQTADGFVAQSLAEYRAGRYRESIAAAEAALKLQPEYAEAWNNIAAAHNALGEWDRGIAAAQKAVALKPTLEIARNNLAYAIAQKARTPANK